MIQPLQLLQKAVGAVLEGRLGGRFSTGPPREDKQYGVWTTLDPGLEDMLRTTTEGKDSVTVYIFGRIQEGQALLEEWNIVEVADTVARLAFRSLFIAIHSLPRLPTGCHFSIGSLPSDVHPISAASLTESELEPFNVIELLGGLATIRYRRNVLTSPALPITTLQSQHIHRPSIFTVPASFESVKIGTTTNQQGSAADDTLELIVFLKKLESRPSLPGLYSDEWLQEFGEDGWAGVLRSWNALQASISSSDDLCI